MGFKLNLCAVLLAVTVGYIVYTTPPWPPAASHRWLKYLTGTYLRFMTLMVSIRCSIATALEIRNGVQTERVCRTADSDCGLHRVHHPDMATYCQSPLAEVLDRFMAFMMRLLCDTRFWIRFKLNSKPTMMLQPASIYIAADWTKRESLCPVHRKSRDIRLFFSTLCTHPFMLSFGCSYIDDMFEIDFGFDLELGILFCVHVYLISRAKAQINLGSRPVLSEPPSSAWGKTNAISTCKSYNRLDR